MILLIVSSFEKKMFFIFLNTGYRFMSWQSRVAQAILEGSFQSNYYMKRNYLEDYELFI